MALFDSIRLGASAAGEDYTINRSLRFNSSDSTQVENTSLGTSPTNRKKATISLWFKRGNNLTSNMGMLTHGYSGSGSSASGAVFRFKDSGTRLAIMNDTNNSTDWQVTPNRFFRDPTAWYHIVVAIDTTQGTASDRVKIYINGVQETDFETANYPSQNFDNLYNYEKARYGAWDGNGYYLGYNGYLAEINSIDGEQLTPASFGETNATTGQWIPKEYTGSYGNNGHYLNFSDNSATTATTLGKDNSGNGKNFTPYNFGTGDAGKDTPTNNFCTLSAIYDAGAAYGSGVLSEGGLRYTGGSSNRSIGSTFGIRHTDTQGYYFEARIISGNQANRLFVGIGYTSTDWISTDARGANDDSWVLRNGDGVFIHNSSVDGETTGAGALSVGDIIQIAVKGSKIWVGKNGSYFFSGNPSGDSTPKFSDIASTWTPVADVMTSNVVQFNFGQDSSFSNTVTAQGNTDGNGNGDFYHSPPTGFLALCSANLPDPTIFFPNKHFDTLLWTANASTQSITGLNFSPDWVWGKSRDDSYDHEVYDTVRGTLKRLKPNATDQELTNAGNLTSFDSGGFTLGSATNMNYNSGSDIVGWCWEGGSSTVSNGTGTITTQVRANPTAGFSIVGYTGNGTSGATIGHGLGVVPQITIIKRREAAEDWMFGIGHILGSGSEGHYIKLNATEAEASGNGPFASTNSSSTVVTIGSDVAVNVNGEDYICYCFSEVAGYSKFGLYTGNGNAEGTFVFTGFRPAFLINKSVSFVKGWRMTDSKRSPTNPIFKSLFPELDQGEYTATGSSEQGQDFLSNGFKLRNTNTRDNQNSSTYFYMAFAEAPYKYSRAR